MMASKGRDTTLPRGHVPAQDESLPYQVELWDAERRRVERLLGRAANESLARAIFMAAQTEHPGRHIMLRHGSRLVAEHRER
jgi:hypothetical protein